MNAVEEKRLVYPYRCTGCSSGNVSVDDATGKAACNVCGWRMQVVEGELIDVLPGWATAGNHRKRKDARR